MRIILHEKRRVLKNFKRFVPLTFSTRIYVIIKSFLLEPREVHIYHYIQFVIYKFNGLLNLSTRSIWYLK